MRVETCFLHIEISLSIKHEDEEFHHSCLQSCKSPFQPLSTVWNHHL